MDLLLQVFSTQIEFFLILPSVMRTFTAHDMRSVKYPQVLLEEFEIQMACKIGQLICSIVRLDSEDKGELNLQDHPNLHVRNVLAPLKVRQWFSAGQRNA